VRAEIDWHSDGKRIVQAQPSGESNERLAYLHFATMATNMQS
jgi:hypothetical protein